jgi:hypothetical protein
MIRCPGIDFCMYAVKEKRHLSESAMQTDTFVTAYVGLTSIIHVEKVCCSLIYHI